MVYGEKSNTVNKKKSQRNSDFKHCRRLLEEAWRRVTRVSGDATVRDESNGRRVLSSSEKAGEGQRRKS